MHQFFDNIPVDQASTVEALSRLMHELREHRKTLLRSTGHDDEETLLAAIQSGEAEEHPAYDHYLGIRTLAATHQAVRAELKNLLGELGGQPGTDIASEHAPPTIWPLHLAETVEENCGKWLAGPVEIRQDALLLTIDGDVRLEVRMAAPDAYSFTWTWGDALLRIDTAPHGNSNAAHLHRADGSRQPSPLPHDATPEARLATLVRLLASDPLLESTP